LSPSTEPALRRVRIGSPASLRKVLRGALSKRIATLVALAMASSLVVPGIALAQQPLLSQGSSGSSVASVQKALGETPTGYFGSQTGQDVRNFQSQRGLAVDGIVGPQTRGALFGSGSSTSTHSSPMRSISSHHSSSSSSSKSSSSSSSSGYSIPSSIVQCESQGNYGAVNSSSGAGGAYQILPSTWRAYGGSGSPQNASKAQQDSIASKIYQSAGASQWSCR
jgi:Transglycosylase-like domain/Putative peptidoglycan binding domain